MRLFADFVELCEHLTKLDSDKAKTSLIAMELQKCSPDERKAWLKLLLISELPPPAGRPIMDKLISSVSGIPEETLKSKRKSAGHGSFVVEELWPIEFGDKKQPLTVKDVLDIYEKGGVEANLARMNGKEVAWLWRIIDRRLFARIGARVVLGAIHQDAFKAYKHAGSLDDILDRFSALSSDKSSGSTSTSPSRSNEITLFTPVKPMLASPCRSIEDLSEQLSRLLRRSQNGNSASTSSISLQVEDKFDGERVQLHLSAEKPPAAFSRNLKALLPWKVDAIRDALPLAFPDVQSCIVDGEILVVDKHTGMPQPFGTLAVHKFAALPDSASVCVVLFDLLYLNGTSLLAKPLAERRTMLKSILKPVAHRVELADARVAKEWSTVEEELENAIQRGIEGLVVKECSLDYRPDARHWWKLKKDYLDGMADTVDLLLLGAYPGTGARGGQLSSFLMGCLEASPTSSTDPLAPASWRTVCRVGSGLSTNQLAEMQSSLHSVLKKADAEEPPSWLSIAPLHKAPFYVVDPRKAPVWELAGTAVLPSPQHTSGYSIRFPRFVRVRPDKDWTMHTSISAMRSLVAPPPRRSFSQASPSSMRRNISSHRPSNRVSISRRI